MSASGRQLYCDFCGKRSEEVAQMIEGPAVHVCNECIDKMHSMIHRPPAGEVYKLRRALSIVPTEA